MTSKYLCAFLQPNDHPPPRLGSVSRLGIKTPKKEVDASRFLYHLLCHSPNPWKLEQEHLEELRKISDPASQIVDELSAIELPDVADWARRLSVCLPPLAHGATSVLPSLTDLANRYFDHVGLALLNLSGKETPYVSLHLAPDTDRVNAINVLLREAKEKKRKPALKFLVQLRDVPTCPVTGLKFRQSEHEKLGMVPQMGVGSELAHIMPFSLLSKTQSHVALEAFTGGTITAEDIVEFINTPENALLLQHDAHQEYDSLFSWAIEAVSGSDGVVRYYSRLVRPGYLSSLTENQMDKEQFFGTNVLNKHPDNLDSLICLPDPRFCNTMLATMRALHASGAADVLDELREDDERSREGGSGMGISNTLDDLLAVKLDLASMSRAMPTSSSRDPSNSPTS